MMEEDKIKQFEIALIELNRHLAYEDKNSAINCYNKLHNIYKEILDSDISHNQKDNAYNSLIDFYEKIASSPQNIIENSDILFLTLFALFSSIILFTGPEITVMLIAKQKADLVKNIYISSTFLFILIPTLIIFIRNKIKKD